MMAAAAVGKSVWILALLGLLTTAGPVRAENVDIDWSLGVVQPPLVVDVDDTLTFQFAPVHTLDAFPDAARFAGCDFTGSTLVAEVGPYVLGFDSPGVYYFGCAVGNHCAVGNMKIQVTVVGSAPVPGSHPGVLTAILLAVGALGLGAIVRRGPGTGERA